MAISQALIDGGKGREYRTFGETKVPTDMPDLVQVQKDSFEWLLGDGLRQLFKEISPITDYTSDNPKYEMSSLSIRFSNLISPRKSAASAKLHTAYRCTSRSS